MKEQRSVPHIGTCPERTHLVNSFTRPDIKYKRQNRSLGKTLGKSLCQTGLEQLGL